MMGKQLSDWLPTTKREAEIRGWNDVDVVLFSGDAYVDHPSFGAALIGRIIEAAGWKIAIVPQPDWHGDLRDFKKFGEPKKFFAISAGCMDSMVNHYTANKRLRSDDPYSPDGRRGLRPDRTTIVYSNILKSLYPNVPIVIGGIEASLRRFAHYDYWDDAYYKSILVDSKADILIYGMGEKPISSIIKIMNEGGTIEDLHNIPQIGYLSKTKPIDNNVIELPSFNQCSKDKKISAQTFKIIEEESNKLNQTIICQKNGDDYVVVNPSFPPMTTEEIDAIYDLPFTRLPHPKYKGKKIPAFDMIRWSINTHRGCWGGCAFCTISIHQGKFIISRSEKSILKEIKALSEDSDFKGYLSDLGGPSANMYMMRGKNEELCKKCKRSSCAFPSVCNNMNTNHEKLLSLYRKVDNLPYIKKCFIGSGVRYDIAMHDTKNVDINKINDEYLRELINKHVSGRLKVAPEHTSDTVLNVMRKPSFSLFHKFKKIFDYENDKHHLNQQIIPYFISSHPGCTIADMAQLAVQTKNMNFHLEQVQDFTPTPMTLATEMFYTGYNPYTLEKIYVAKTTQDKLAQRQFFFWYLPEKREEIKKTLRKNHLEYLIDKLFENKDCIKKDNYFSYERNRKNLFKSNRKK